MLALSLLVGAACVSAQHFAGSIMIREDGVNMTRYVMSGYAPMVSVSGTSVTLVHNSGVQITKTQTDSYSPDIFQQYKLRGKTVSYTVDISSIGCSCNAAFYLVTMPAIGSNGQPTPGNDGSYYCDANDVNSEWCWELDIMESNKYVTAVTPHKCYQPPGQYDTSCDRGGCGTNSHNVNGQGMCPDGSCTINTAQPFRYSVTFGDQYRVVLSQNGRTFEFDSCDDAGYLQSMEQALDFGMTIVASYWGNNYQTMQWLDGMTGCGGDCDTSGRFTFSDIEIYSANTTKPFYSV